MVRLGRFLGLVCALIARRIWKWLMGGEVERVKGIEPSCRAWEARVLPLNYTRFRKVG